MIITLKLQKRSALQGGDNLIIETMYKTDLAIDDYPEIIDVHRRISAPLYEALGVPPRASSVSSYLLADLKDATYTICIREKNEEKIKHLLMDAEIEADL